jgi:spermidine synthase
MPVQPWRTFDRAVAKDGTELILACRGEEWVVRAGGRVLMSSRAHASEEALATIALERWSAQPGRGGAGRVRNVLLGGIGLGYTLRTLLDGVGPEATVVVAELVPEVARWVAGPAAHLARRPLEDPRVRLQVGDVLSRIAEARRAFDLILLDVDNGPSPLAHPANADLYGDAGIAACHGALRSGGVLAVWSAGPDDRYLQRLERAGFASEAPPVRAGPGAGPRHAILVGVKSIR